MELKGKKELSAAIVNDWRSFAFLSMNAVSIFFSGGANQNRIQSSSSSSTDKNTFDDFSTVEILGLNNLGLQKIESNLFQDLSKLKKLDLSLNQINEIDLNGFQGLENLEDLNLRQNQIVKIHSNQFQNLNKLRILNLGNIKILRKILRMEYPLPALNFFIIKA
jgi:Leucine-rich repeat (LRR) protein